LSLELNKKRETAGPRSAMSLSHLATARSPFSLLSLFLSHPFRPTAPSKNGDGAGHLRPNGSSTKMLRRNTSPLYNMQWSLFWSLTVITNSVKDEWNGNRHSWVPSDGTRRRRRAGRHAAPTQRRRDSRHRCGHHRPRCAAGGGSALHPPVEEEAQGTAACAPSTRPCGDSPRPHPSNRLRRSSSRPSHRHLVARNRGLTVSGTLCRCGGLRDLPPYLRRCAAGCARVWPRFPPALHLALADGQPVMPDVQHNKHQDYRRHR
jgi:hypothetical protein